jgi:hypothetical protein
MRARHMFKHKREAVMAIEAALLGFVQCPLSGVTRK